MIRYLPSRWRMSEQGAGAVIRRPVRSPRLGRLASVLRDRRVRSGLNQSDVAESLGWAQSAIADVEAGRRRVDVFEFLDYAHALGSDPHELLSELIRESET